MAFDYFGVFVLFYSHFDNVMMQFIINKRTDADAAQTAVIWKTYQMQLEVSTSIVRKKSL